MECLLELIVGISLFILFVGTILKEFLKLDSFCAKFPLLSNFLPSWSFFAPRPYKSDYFLFYRFIYEDNCTGEWHQANEVLGDRPLYSFLWNPKNRFLKGFIDAISDLIKYTQTMKINDVICVSVPYLHLLNFVHSFPKDPLTSKIQFMIMSQSKLYKSKLVFLSEPHPVKKNANVL
jgi:hypothetical protein